MPFVSSHQPVLMQATFSSHHSGIRGRSSRTLSPHCRLQAPESTLAAFLDSNPSSSKLHFTSSPSPSTHHNAGFLGFFPSYRMRGYSANALLKEHTTFTLIKSEETKRLALTQCWRNPGMKLKFATGSKWGSPSGKAAYKYHARNSFPELMLFPSAEAVQPSVPGHKKSCQWTQLQLSCASVLQTLWAHFQLILELGLFVASEN